ncbi:hypothetical protein BKP37_15865 [Anaerobacillus alkalilacustris]|uniref:DUF4305 domain-containing protein n=1 Tax=Anaerobacillus alkalilacustris TaxID=393763 RepID=A0A1S2LG32_9BACI|nr:YdiK family protein [Anaerobacillus alkalilacustris]OIJ11351.1 hypothetical protein BKP37_15865 [Anaerobacillus alkalilacustris]
MRSPYVWGIIYFFMGCLFVYFAIQQNTRTGQWDFFTIALMALAAYDFTISYRYFAFKKILKRKNKD